MTDSRQSAASCLSGIHETAFLIQLLPAYHQFPQCVCTLFSIAGIVTIYCYATLIGLLWGTVLIQRCIYVSIVVLYECIHTKVSLRNPSGLRTRSSPIYAFTTTAFFFLPSKVPNKFLYIQRSACLYKQCHSYDPILHNLHFSPVPKWIQFQVLYPQRYHWNIWCLFLLQAC